MSKLGSIISLKKKVEENFADLSHTKNIDDHNQDVSKYFTASERHFSGAIQLCSSDYKI